MSEDESWSCSSSLKSSHSTSMASDAAFSDASILGMSAEKVVKIFLIFGAFCGSSEEIRQSGGRSERWVVITGKVKSSAIIPACLAMIDDAGIVDNNKFIYGQGRGC